MKNNKAAFPVLDTILDQKKFSFDKKENAE